MHMLAALQALTAQMEIFAKHQGFDQPSGSKPCDDVADKPRKAKTKSNEWPRDVGLTILLQAPHTDHELCSSVSASKSSSSHQKTCTDSDTETSDSFHSTHDIRPELKKPRKSSAVRPSPSNPFTFNTEDITHPRSTDWVPAQAVTEYLRDKLRNSFDKEVRNRLQAECHRPDIPDKMVETPETDYSMLTFLKK
ncbi:hypothetical protein NDU88_000357 [Pleurodeles waltl]|uniref:Uncharacterized protein n=1 Tax=Pleurodeles waltl TaxID=8319 RepID=A0AAV7N7P2_PLEWA|nr:hypothetical protein NDU88_000357 [Pleurodeles waltl]